jgi:hypothetical protein
MYCIYMPPENPFFFCRSSKRNAVNQPIIDIEDDNTPALSDLATSSTIEDVSIRLVVSAIFIKPATQYS